MMQEQTSLGDQVVEHYEPQQDQPKKQGNQDGEEWVRETGEAPGIITGAGV